MRRSGIVLCVLCVGCGGRPAGSTDLGRAERSSSKEARPPAPDRTPDAPAACTSLKLLGQATLEFADTMKLGPRIVFDGEGFALVWHSQPAIISSLNGELRYARVDATGKPSSPDGISLGSDNGALLAALTSSFGKHAVVHMPSSASVPGVELRQFDAAGKTLSVAQVEGNFHHAAIAPHPLGHALLLAGQGGSPQLLVVQDKAGVAPSPKQIPTAQIMASVWLAPHAKGFAAALYTTNSVSSLYLIGPDLAVLGPGSVGHGQLIQSPSFAVLSDGFASLYEVSGAIESEVYDAAGKATNHQTLGTTASSGNSRDTALVWTGTQLVAVHPGLGGQLRAQLLDSSGVSAGSPTAVPACLATSREPTAAWGKSLLAVATVSEASGVMKSSVCVTLMGCP